MSNRYELTELDQLASVHSALGVQLPVMAVVGDSISAQNNFSDTNSISHSPRGYATWFRYFTRQRFYFPPENNFGVPGERTFEIRDRIGAIMSSTASLVFVHAGTNDINSNLPADDAIANLKTIYDRLYTAGKIVFAIPILGRSGEAAFNSTQLAQANKINQWIRMQGLIRRNFYVVDCGVVFDDPAASIWADRSGYTIDGLHPSCVGAAAIGKRAAAIADKVFPDWAFPVTNQSDVYDAANNPYGNLVPNGMFAGGASSATGWTYDVSTTGGGTATASKITLTDGRPGQKIALSGSVTGTNRVATLWRACSAQSLVAGDQVEAAVELLQNSLVGILSVTLQLWTVESGNNHFVRDMERVATVNYPAIVDNGVMKTPRRVLTAAPSNLYLFMYVYMQSPATSLAISGDVTFASAAVRKVN